QVIAEGIENITQLRALQKLGCEYGQGYLFQKAVPAERAIALLSRPLDSWNDWQHGWGESPGNHKASA
ncbi:MAG: EAL domain-containing protein, partial [Cyanobacteria bacterium J06649_5]